MAKGSPWLSKGPAGRTFPRLESDLATEVIVIGGGIAGISTARRLTELGAETVLLEARRVAAGVTGNSSAKLSALHGVAYSTINEAVGEEAGRAYARLNLLGMDLIAGTADAYGIECALRRKAARTYTISPDNLESLEAEAAAARVAGLNVTTTTDPELPFDVAGCIELADQAQFDPVAWARGVASHLSERGVKVFEDTRAVKVDSGNPCVVEVEHGNKVSGSRVVVATHPPFLDRGLQFARLSANASHAVAAESPVMPRSAMYLSIDDPTRSIRVLDGAETGGTEMLFLGGSSRRIGSGSAEAGFEDLEELMRSRFQAGPIRHRWMAHDYMSPDRLPYVGKLQPLDERLLVSTGFSKWGLAAGAGAGALLAERIAGKRGDDDEVFEPARLSLKETAATVLKESATNAGHFVGGRVGGHVEESELEPGTGGLVRAGREIQAVYRRDDGSLLRLSATCTHLGCIVSWNATEKTWDCPCHGSRFNLDGEVLAGPATEPLPKR